MMTRSRSRGRTRRSTRSRPRCASPAARWSSGWCPATQLDRDRRRARAAPATRPRPAATSSPAATRAAPARCSPRSPGFRDLAAHPLVLGALDRVLGDHATSYQLHLTQVIEIGPGEPAQLVHRDQWAFDFFPFPSGFEVECHTMWAMNDFTEENGATRVHPRQQPLGRQAAAARPTRPCRPRCRRARCCSTSARCTTAAARTVRRSRGAASTSATRCRGCGRRRTSTSRARPRSRASCPSRSRGSRATERGAYALGYYGDLRDPIEALHGESDAAPSFLGSRTP